MQKDIDYARRRKALKESLRILKESRHYLKTGDSDGYCREVTRALNRYFAGKFNLEAAGLTGNQAISTCTDCGLSEDLIEQLEGYYTTCDMAKFAGGSIDGGQMAELSKNVGVLLRRMEKEIKNRSHGPLS